MNYIVEIDIDLPVGKVVELFDSPDNIMHWQHDLISLEVVSGVRGEVGAESILTYKMGSREIEMTEVITVKDLPSRFSGVYETTNVWNLVENSFIELTDSKTRWICKNEFKCSGFVQLMAMLMPSTFKKQSCKYQQQFKSFAEAQ